MTAASRAVTIVNLRGLHARAAAKFCDLAQTFDAAITVSKDRTVVGGCSLMALLMLGAGKGSKISIAADGPDAEAAIERQNRGKAREAEVRSGAVKLGERSGATAKVMARLNG